MRQRKLTFEEIMAYHPENKQVFTTLKNSIRSVIPFVRAGLSAFVIHDKISIIILLRDVLVKNMTKKDRGFLILYPFSFYVVDDNIVILTCEIKLKGDEKP